MTLEAKERDGRERRSEMEEKNGNDSGIDGKEMGGGWDLFEPSHSDLSIKAELCLLLC